MKKLVLLMLWCVGCNTTPEAPQQCAAMCRPNAVKKLTVGWEGSCECMSPTEQPDAGVPEALRP